MRVSNDFVRCCRAIKWHAHQPGGASRNSQALLAWLFSRPPSRLDLTFVPRRARSSEAPAPTWRSSAYPPSRSVRSIGSGTNAASYHRLRMFVTVQSAGGAFSSPEGATRQQLIKPSKKKGYGARSDVCFGQRGVAGRDVFLGFLVSELRTPDAERGSVPYEPENPQIRGGSCPGMQERQDVAFYSRSAC